VLGSLGLGDADLFDIGDAGASSDTEIGNDDVASDGTPVDTGVAETGASDTTPTDVDPGGDGFPPVDFGDGR